MNILKLFYLQWDLICPIMHVKMKLFGLWEDSDWTPWMPSASATERSLSTSRGPEWGGKSEFTMVRRWIMNKTHIVSPEEYFEIVQILFSAIVFNFNNLLNLSLPLAKGHTK